MAKKKLSDWQQINQSIQEAYEEELVAADRRQSLWGKLVACLLGMIGFGILFFGLWRFQPTKELPSHQTEQVIGSYPLLTEHRLENLPLGLSQKEVEATYGPASKQEEFEEFNDFTAVYAVDEHESASLYFDCDGGDCLLDGKSGFFLSSQAVENFAPGEQNLAWDLADYQALMTQSLTSNQEGLSLEAVLVAHGRPSDIVTTYLQLSVNDQPTRVLRLRYRPQTGPYKWLDLTFESVGQAPYQLVEKQAKRVEGGEAGE